MEKLDIPMNATERYLYNMCIRLDAMVHMLSSIVEVMAKQKGIATENNTVVEQLPRTRKKSKE